MPEKCLHLPLHLDAGSWQDLYLVIGSYLAFLATRHFIGCDKDAATATLWESEARRSRAAWISLPEQDEDG